MRRADLNRFGSEHSVREHGLPWLEGSDYRIEDADIIRIRFST